MEQEYFAVPKVIFSIGDRMLFTDKETGMVVKAIFEYFVGKEPLETVTSGMSTQLENAVTCIICMMEEDYESF